MIHLIINLLAIDHFILIWDFDIDCIYLDLYVMMMVMMMIKRIKYILKVGKLVKCSDQGDGTGSNISEWGRKLINWAIHERRRKR